MTVEIGDGLTDEERAALAEDDDAGASATNQDAPDGAGGNDGKSTESAESSTAAGGDDAATNADPTGEPVAKADDGGPAPTETQPQSAPILIAKVPEDVDAKLAEIATQKNDLLDKFDNGDMTAREYQTQLDALNKQERNLELDIREANLAAKMEQTRLQNDWNATCARFVDSNPMYKDNQRLYRALDAEVRELATKPETANWSGQRFLEEAHKNLSEAFGFKHSAPKPDPSKAPKPVRELPPNLAKVPSAEIEDTSGGQFAVLNRLLETNPAEAEEVISKMTEKQRNAFLASA